MIKGNTKRSNRNWIFDISVVFGFIIIALAFTLGRVGTHLKDYAFLSSDAANISSFAAALDQPKLFSNDPLLNNPANFAFYNTVHVPIIRILGKVIGNYGSAFALLIFPVTFLHLLGYYLLGDTLFRNRVLAVILTLTVMVPVKLNLGEGWGLLREAVPRFLFQALLPFLLVVVIKWGKNPKFWLWLMAAAGLLVYAHPVSLPAWGLAVFLSLWFLAPGMPLRQKIYRLLLAGMLFLIVITPFTINYLSSTKFGSQEEGNYENILTIMRKRFISGFIDLRAGYKGMIKEAVFSHWLNTLLWALVFVGGIGIYLFHRNTQDRTALVIAAWWVGILLVGVVIPVVDHSLAAALKRIPLEVDLIRSLRYMIPLLLLSAFYLLSQLWVIVKKKVADNYKPLFSSGVVILGVYVMLSWMLRYQFFQDPAFIQSAACWGSGRLACPLPEEDKLVQRVELLKAIKSVTPPGSRILGSDMSDLAIRYFALRPLVYTYKDGGAFIYANHVDLMNWWQQFQAMSEVERLKDNRNAYLDAFMDFANKYSADYIVLPEGYVNGTYYPPSMKKIYANPNFSLFLVVN